MKKNMWRSLSTSSSNMSDTNHTRTTAGSSEFSSSSLSSVNSSESSFRRRKNMSDVFLSCLGMESHEEGSTNLDIKQLLQKKMSLQVISGTVKFTWDEILKATKGFSKDMIIGEGGFSHVYIGRLQNGKEVAIKRTKKDACDEQFLQESFQTEIATLQNINHMSLVGFYGYLLFEDEKIIVVEYVSNGNLRQHLDCSNGEVLQFANRLDILTDVAHAITYLHTYCDKPLIHRDIKSSNILVTSTLHGKVADFGLAKLASTDVNNTVIQTVAKGTPGYIDPEYFRTNQLTSKSDVYSFGVLLVETVTGKRPVERYTRVTTAKWALGEFREGRAIDTLDPKLNANEAITEAVQQIYDLASRCIVVDRKKRPTMAECGRILWNIRKTYNDMLKMESNDR